MDLWAKIIVTFPFACCSVLDFFLLFVFSHQRSFTCDEAERNYKRRLVYTRQRVQVWFLLHVCSLVRFLKLEPKKEKLQPHLKVQCVVFKEDLLAGVLYIKYVLLFREPAATFLQSHRTEKPNNDSSSLHACNTGEVSVGCILHPRH